MTVGELKLKLAEYPEDLVVMIDGYEGGYQEEVTFKYKRMALDVNKYCNYYGPHQEADLYQEGEGELHENSVCSILEHTADDGKKYKTTFYNSDFFDRPIKSPLGLQMPR